MSDMEKLAQWHDGMAVWPVQERHTGAAATPLIEARVREERAQEVLKLGERIAAAIRKGRP